MAVAPRNGPLPPHMKSNFMGTMPRASKYAFLRQWAGLKPLKCSGGAAMMVMNLPSPLEHVEGFRPAHCWRKHIRLLGASYPINQTCRSRIFGLLGGARGPFLAAVAMVMWGLLAVGCWLLAAGCSVVLLAQILHNSRNSINVHTQHIFFRSKIFWPI
jgi:hypothetical protein